MDLNTNRESENYYRFLAEIKSLLALSSSEEMIENFRTTMEISDQHGNIATHLFLEADKKNAPWQERLLDFIFSARFLLREHGWHIKGSHELLRRLDALEEHFSNSQLAAS
jgi:hypothetical protein